MSSRSIRCALVSTDRLLVAGLESVLRPYIDIEVVEVDPANVRDSALVASSDVVLFEVERQLTSQESLIRSVSRNVASPTTQTLGLIGRAFSRSIVQAARRMGVDLFVSTSLPASDIYDALRRAVQGRSYGAGRESSSISSPWPGQADGLTERESQVVMMLATGLSNRQIADRLFVSIETVRTHVKRAYQRLGIRNRAQAATYVHELVRPDTVATYRPATIVREAETFDVLDVESLSYIFQAVGSVAWEVGPVHLRVVVISNGHVGLTVIGKTDREAHRIFGRFFPPNDGLQFLSMFDALAVGERRTFDHTLIVPGRGAREVRSSLVTVHNNSGELVINGVTIDVTGTTLTQRSAESDDDTSA